MDDPQHKGKMVTTDFLNISMHSGCIRPMAAAAMARRQDRVRIYYDSQTNTLGSLCAHPFVLR
jgi:hypothetical protein